MNKKMGFFEKIFEKHEVRRCEKYGRLNFLQKNKNNFKLGLTFTIAFTIYCVSSLILGLLCCFGNPPNYSYIMLFIFSGFFLFIAIIWGFFYLPYYKKKCKEWKIERTQNDEIKNDDKNFWKILSKTVDTKKYLC